MKSHLRRNNLSKDSVKLQTKPSENNLIRPTETSNKARKHSSKNQSLKRITMKVFKQNKENLMGRMPATTTGTSLMTSYMDTPSRQLTLNCLPNHRTNELTLSKSVSRMLSRSKVTNMLSDRQHSIKVYYGELTLSHNFSSNTKISEIHCYFFREMVKLEKTKYSRVLPFIGFEGIKFNSYLDYWINQKQESLSIITQNITDCIKLRPIFAVRPPRRVNLNDFQIFRCIGVGGFSKVYLGKCNFTGQLCAMKFISKSYIVSNKKQRLIINQREVLSSLNHPNLVNLYYAFQTKNFIVFVMQYCPNNELYQYLMEKGKLEENEVYHIFSKVLEGVGYLHEHKIIYRDIKLENILIDAYGEVKISDFGLSKPRCEKEDITYTYCGSPEYMAPEMLMKYGHSYEVDYYALGVLLFQLLVGRSPFVASTKQEIYYLALNHEVTFPKNITLSKEVKGLIKGLLHKNPAHRIGTLYGIKEIQFHPWMKKHNGGVGNCFYGLPFREYLEAREPNNQYIDKEIAQDGSFQPTFPDIYYENPKFQEKRKEDYTQNEKMAQKLMLFRKAQLKMKETRETRDTRETCRATLPSSNV